MGDHLEGKLIGKAPSSSRRFVFFTLLSIGLHLGSGLILWNFAVPESTPVPDQVIEVNILPKKNLMRKKIFTSGGSPPADSRGLKKTKPSLLTTKKRIGLGELRPKYHPKVFVKPDHFYRAEGKFIGGAVGSEVSRFDSENGVFGIMNKTSLREHLADFGFFQTLWKKIDDHIIYPRDFADHRIQGKFTVRALFSRQGRLLNVREITGPENLLKPYLLVALSKVLKDPLPKPVWLQKKKTIPILLSFDFKPVVGQRIAKTRINSIVKNALSFHKSRVVRSKFNESIQEFYEAYVPPIIVIPGGVMIDLVRVYKIYKNWGQPKKDSTSKRRRRRLQFLKRELREQLK